MDELNIIELALHKDKNYPHGYDQRLSKSRSSTQGHLSFRLNPKPGSVHPLTARYAGTPRGWVRDLKDGRVMDNYGLVIVATRVFIVLIAPIFGGSRVKGVVTTTDRRVSVGSNMEGHDMGHRTYTSSIYGLEIVFSEYSDYC